jgi:hypothetical protein
MNIPKIYSLLPPTIIKSVTKEGWYILTTDKKLGWIYTDVEYSLEEIHSKWVRDIRPVEKVEKIEPTPVEVFTVNGSKGKVYTVTKDKNKYSCTCPAYGFGRGRDCKHILGLKNNS